jgi:ABC-2 type transport system ATP-binding protein
MMKLGKIVAVDTTDRLLNAFSERVLRVRIDGELPHSQMAARTRQVGAWHHFAIHDLAEVEARLAALRIAGVHVTNMEVAEPDLEEVFLKLMHR